MLCLYFVRLKLSSFLFLPNKAENAWSELHDMLDENISFNRILIWCSSPMGVQICAGLLTCSITVYAARALRPVERSEYYSYKEDFLQFKYISHYFFSPAFPSQWKRRKDCVFDHLQHLEEKALLTNSSHGIFCWEVFFSIFKIGFPLCIKNSSISFPKSAEAN